MTSHLISHAGHYAAILLVCAFAVAPLSRAAWTRRSPRLGIVVWQTLLLSWWSALIGLLLAAGLSPYGMGELAALWEFLTGARIPLHSPHWIALAIAAAMTAAMLVLPIWYGVAAARARRRHRAGLDLVSCNHANGWTVVEHPSVIAYCVPGRDARLVISAGALAVLSPPQVTAVAAHERAHARERHDLVLLPFAALARTRLPLFATMLSAVSLLVEMRADDRAMAVAGPAALSGALRHFGDSGAVAPAGALSAAGQLPARRRRACEPPAPLPAGVTVLVVASAITVATTPISIMLYPLSYYTM